MDSFSPASLYSLCSAITQHLVSSTSEIKGLLQSTPQNNYATQQITSLSAALDANSIQITQVEQALRSATVISTRVQQLLTDNLTSCNSAAAKLYKQLMRLHGENLTKLDVRFVEAHIALLMTLQALFQYLAQTLAINQRDGQDSNLNKFEAQQLIQQATTQSHAASENTSVLLDEAITLADLPHRLKSQDLPQDEPPPYAPTDPSSSTSQRVQTPPQPDAGPSTAPQSGGFSFGKTLKAFAQSFMPKADPFVNALCQAVTKGDIQQIAGLLSQGININGKGDEGHTPLQCAIIANQEQAANVLLSAGANYSSFGGWGHGMPPMFQAAAAGRIGIAKIIMDKGVRATEESITGQPYFIDVVSSNNMDGIRFLLDHGAKATSTCISGRPVLVQAVKQNNVELVNLLIQFGAKVSASDITGSSILAVAMEKKYDLEMVQTLLNHGAKPDSKTIYGATVLVDAITRRRLDLARLLLDNGAKGNKDDVSGQPIILVVIKDSKIKTEDKADLVRRLLENGASSNAKDMSTSAPALSFALDSGIPELVELLLEHGAKTTVKTRNGEPLLIYAVDNGKMTEARMLLEHGADANGANKQGKTPLMQAVINQDLELIKLLMDHGADVNAVGSVSIASFAGALNRPDILNVLGLGGTGHDGALPEYQESAKS